ncbi:S1/P1 nuclease [Thalassomonas sp. M1454]|uniref:S1/P1 nuclease n=1 Tax=Thalassomonas sp. M1454 TaxID=2594477 RepID=UPI00117ECB65|nr:S1/P1 nuclease [Thalassomonas sp. M1454]TRX55228.1 S1/P1 nuclease [Thalassomonas sp. M1454]
MKVFLILILLFSSQQLFAFDTKTHRLVCQLAYQQLPISKQKNIDILFNKMAKQEQYRINQYLHRSKDTKVHYIDSCVWADAIKQDKKYKKYNNWHFINIARDQNRVSKSACNHDCIIDAIDIHHHQFIHSSQQPWLKTQALMFISHWIADLHQPLHVSFKSDLGGNKTKVISSNKRCNNLHAIWDHCLIWLEKPNYQQVLTELSFARSINSKDEINSKNVLLWANESFAITRNKATRYCDLNTIDNECKSTTGPLYLSKKYYVHNSSVLKDRIKQASRRLYVFLDKQF